MWGPLTRRQQRRRQTRERLSRASFALAIHPPRNSETFPTHILAVSSLAGPLSSLICLSGWKRFQSLLQFGQRSLARPRILVSGLDLFVSRVAIWFFAVCFIYVPCPFVLRWRSSRLAVRPPLPPLSSHA